MAERISKHCWATPKCGIMTASKYFEFEKAIDFQFVIVRNPYRRMVSFYISKVIEHGAAYGADRQIPHIGKTGVHLNCTFEEVLPHVSVLGERHLRLQLDKVTKFAHFVRLEHWAEDMKLVCDKLDLDYDKYKSVGVNRSLTTDIITRYVGDKPPSWFRKKGIPSDYSLFYNDQTKKLVYDLYKKDFDWLVDVYDDLEVI